MLGSIPIVELCRNRRGEPESRPGYVSTSGTTNEVGNCYQNDQKTLVNPVQHNGNYFACGGGQGTVCDTTFTIARQNIELDVRYRPSVLEKRKTLKPEWRGPYFAPWANLSIAYEVPIFFLDIVF